jgi:hypothetical protein
VDSPLERTVTVGSVSESTQHVTLPGIVTVSRSRALRVPWWVLAVHGLLTASGGYWGGILADLAHRLLDPP